MSAEFSFSSTENLATSGTPVTAFPYSIAMWVKVPSSNFRNNNFLVGLASSNTEWAGTMCNASEVPQMAGCDNSIVDTITDSNSTNLGDSSWHHILAVWTSATSRELFVDGASGGTDTSSTSPAAHTNFYFGNPGTEGDENPAPDGTLIAEVALYSAALGSTEASQLYNGGSGGGGMNPTAVSSANLQAYWPINTSFDLTDHKASYDLTNSGTVVYNADNPTVDAEASAAFPYHSIEQQRRDIKTLLTM